MSDAPDIDRHDLYEQCVQSPVDLVPLLRAIHGANPAVLGEDFCGTAALSREWIGAAGGAGAAGDEGVAGVADVADDGAATLDDRARAIAVDHDEATIEAARARRDAILGATPARADRLSLVAGDVIDATRADAAGPHGSDVVYCGNFSIGEWHARAALVRYLRHVRSRLRRGGVFVCDVYGGETSFILGSYEQPMSVELHGVACDVLYEWEQRDANPLTGRVENAIHFTVLDDDGEAIARLEDAFVYRWRLWGIPELRDAMAEAGFTTTEVCGRRPAAVEGDGTVHVDRHEDASELEDSFDVLVVGRTSDG